MLGERQGAIRAKMCVYFSTAKNTPQHGTLNIEHGGRGGRANVGGRMCVYFSNTGTFENVILSSETNMLRPHACVCVCVGRGKWVGGVANVGEGGGGVVCAFIIQHRYV